MMDDILGDLTRPLGHVVHIGAGEAPDLTPCLEAGAKAVVLIEADGDTADRLGALAADHPQVTAIHAAVSGDSRPRAFRRMNFPDLNSFREPTGLKELFPGLRILSEDVVRPGDPVALIAPLDLDGARANILVIEAPGEALGILKALSADGVLPRFDVVRVQEAHEALYDRAPLADEVRDFLDGAGFTTSFEADPQDPERPYLLGYFDRTVVKAEQESDELAQALKTVKAQAKQIKTLTAAQDAAQQSSRKQAKQIKTMEGAHESAQKALKKAAQDQDEKIKTLTRALDLAQKDVGNLRNALAGVQQQSGDQVQQIKALGAARDAAKSDLEALRMTLEAAQQKSTEQAKQIEALVVARDAAEQEAENLYAAFGEIQQQSADQVQQIETLGAARAAAEKDAGNLRNALGEVQQQSADQVQQITALGAARDAAKSELEVLRATLEAAQRQSGEQAQQINALGAARDAAEEDAGNLRNALAGVQQQSAEQVQQITALGAARDAAESDLEALRATLEAAQRQSGEQAHQIEALGAARDAAKSELETQRTTLAETQQNLFVSLRMQALRATDLKDLQQRYASLLQGKEAQDELLQRLTASLGNAAHYLQNMDETPAVAAPVKRRKPSPRRAKKAIAPNE